MQLHNLGENALFTTLASGTFIDGQGAGGTAAGVVSAGAYEYHLVLFSGTLANNGTINVYGCTNSGGSSPVVLKTLNVGSANGAGAAIDVRSNTLTGLSVGTVFTHLAAAGTVETGGTWRGALQIISYWPKTAPTSNGLAAYGSSLY